MHHNQDSRQLYFTHISTHALSLSLALPSPLSLFETPSSTHCKHRRGCKREMVVELGRFKKIFFALTFIDIFVFPCVVGKAASKP
jgi:hypothetical protein